MFVEDDGTFVLEDARSFDSLTSQQKMKLTKPLMNRLIDPDIKSGVSQSLSAIFPTLPKQLVSYRGKGDFTLNLELKELLEIAIALGNELNPPQKSKDDEIAQLQEQIKMLQTKS